MKKMHGEKESVHGGGIPIDLLNLVIFTVVSVVVFLAMSANIQLGNRFEEMVVSQKNYMDGQKSAQDLQNGSDNLTFQVQHFVISGKLSYLQAYFEEIHSERREQAIENLQGTAFDVELLDAAKQASDDLMIMEIHAMKLVVLAKHMEGQEIPDEVMEYPLSEQERAMSSAQMLAAGQEMIFGDTYNEKKNAIDDMIQRFVTDALDNLEQILLNASERVSRHIFWQKVLMICLIFITITMVFLIYTQITMVLKKYIHSIHGDENLEENGVYELRYLANTYNENVDKKNRREEELRQERKQYREALMNDCLFTFIFNVTTGGFLKAYEAVDGVIRLVEDGDASKISYDVLMPAWLEQVVPEVIRTQIEEQLCSQTLLDIYNSGEKQWESEFYSSGYKIYYRITVLLSENNSNNDVMACVIVKDITESKNTEVRYQEALHSAVRAATLASQAKTDFMSRMSHDIRTPLNGIMGMTQIAKRRSEDKEAVEQCLDKISETSGYLLKLFDEVLDMSKIESGRLYLEEKPFIMTEAMEAVVTVMQQAFEQKRQRFQADISSFSHNRVYGDDYRIQQICMDFLSNANQYTDEGGEIRMEVREREKRNNMACFEFVFSDTGVGMEPEFVERIFEPFVRAEDTRVNKVHGTGLGMTIVHSIVEMMDGNIQVKSAPGEGSVFTVTLYLRIEEPDGEPADVAAQSDTENDGEKSSENCFAGKRVMMVEDNELNAEITMEFLSYLGVETDWASNGKIAVDMFKESGKGFYDLILMDLQMPVMNGLEAAAYIRGMSHPDAEKIPIIALTANAFADDIRDARDAGMNEHVAKPVDVEKLWEVMGRWFR